MEEESSFVHKLEFGIIRHSSFSGTYAPTNILIDLPSDQSSRWSSDSNSPPQYLLLKLAKPAIVHSVKFGKFEKAHVCNMKRFKIYGGLCEEGMIELLSSGLKNDPEPENFSLRFVIDGKLFPCRLLKIVPLQSWGPTFNFSIWYVEFSGDDRSSSVDPCILSYNQFRRKEALRLCLKFLRDSDHQDICDELQRRTDVYLEHPVVTQLHHNLISSCNYEACELLMVKSANEGLFDEYLAMQPYRPTWVQLSNDSSHVPGMRGGHQMVLDAQTQTIYLFGGWDGFRDLADFWSYSINSGHWKLLSEDTESDGGPSPRSCHKMVIDNLSSQIFVFGRYVESINRTANNLKSDLFSYHIPTSTWQLVADDTYCMGGPRLIFDHQLVIDTENRVIYCFGGKILTPSTNPNVSIETKLLEPSDSQYSGLYSYHIPTNSWNLLRRESKNSLSTGGIKSRSGHSAIFCQSSKKIYMFAGQRFKEICNDFLVYDVDEDTLYSENDRYGISMKIPEGVSTQRATIDQELGEIYVLSGSLKTKEKDIKNSFWVYNIVQKIWTCVYENEINSLNKYRDVVPTKDQLIRAISARRATQKHHEPCPRYAHQMVYDSYNKVHYLFGGNPGTSTTEKTRLNDFWELKLEKPCLEDVICQCQWKLRRMRFFELAHSNKVEALQYLQTKLADIVRPNDEKQSHELHKLANYLFDENELEKEIGTCSPNELFESLLCYFPKTMRPPETNLIDLVKA